MPPMHLRGGLVRGGRSRARRRDADEDAPTLAAVLPTATVQRPAQPASRPTPVPASRPDASAPRAKRAAPAPRRKDWKEWSCQEVCSWVSETLTKHQISGEAAIVAAFQAQEIKGSHLPMLSHELLHDELAFGALGHRLTFLQERDKLVAPGGHDDERKGEGEAGQKISALLSSVSSLQQSVAVMSARFEELATKRGLGKAGTAAPVALVEIDGKDRHEKRKTEHIGNGGEKEKVAVHDGGKQKLGAQHKADAAIKPSTAGSERRSVAGSAEAASAQTREKAGAQTDTAPKSKTDEGRPHKQRWTHFVALPVENREVLSALAMVQHDVSARSPALVPGLISPAKFHASLAIVHCADDAALARARLALHKCAPELSSLFVQGKYAKGAQFNIKGVGHFRNGVLWAGVEDAWKLAAVATVVQKRLRQAGPGVTVEGKDGCEEEGGGQLQGHVTLMKTSHFTGKQRAALGKGDKDLGRYTERWKDYDFGWETASLLHLCAMKTRGRGGVSGGGEGGYVVDGIVHLPPAFCRLPSVVSWSHAKVKYTSSGAAATCPSVDGTVTTRHPGGPLAVKVKFSYDDVKTGVVAVGIEVERASVGPKSQKSVMGSGSEKTADTCRPRPAPPSAATQHSSPSTDGKEPLALRKKLAQAIEAALLSWYSYRVVEDEWSESLEELTSIQDSAAAQLEATGSALVTYAHAPPRLDAVMTVDIRMTCSSAAATPPDATKQWADLVEQGWKAALQASTGV